MPLALSDTFGMSPLAEPQAPLTTSAVALPPRADCIAGSSDESWDYRDRFSVDTLPGQYTSVDHVAIDWFTNQPTWIRLLSTNTLSKAGVDEAVAAGGFGMGSAVGTWVVTRRNDHEIVFGQRLGFMEYWFSFLLPTDAPDTVEASTSVKFLWRRTGRFYFALVRPMHKRFVRLLLAKTVSPQAARVSATRLGGCPTRCRWGHGNADGAHPGSRTAESR